MVLEIGITLLGVAAVGFTTNYFENKIKKEKNKISIKESMDLTQLPVITFQEGNKKLNFIFDSGSSHSHISAEVAKELVGTPIETNYTYTTAIGSDNSSKMIETLLKYKDKEFKVDLFINETLDNAFKVIKNNCGVQLHGILGTDFLKEYKYILDFAELVVYNK